jgi:hypothetical protein
MQIFALGTMVLCFALLGQVARAQVVFSDTFDAENGGVTQFNYSGFAQWTVSNGSVDLIGNGSSDPYPGNGMYVDLDGTSFDAATFTSSPIGLIPGQYKLTFELGYNTNGPADNQMTVSLGGAYSELIVNADAGFPVFSFIERSITVASAGAYSIQFDHLGGDNQGLIIDDVTLSRVPEPGTIAIAAAALCALGLRRI